MLTDSFYKNAAKPDKERKCQSPGLSSSAIEIIAGCNPDQLRGIYEKYSIRYLMREIPAWEKLGKYDVATRIKNIIEERKNISRLDKLQRLKSNIDCVPNTIGA
jgi:hypothetical protein